MKKYIEWVREQIKEERNLLNDTRYEKEVDDLTTGILLGLKKALNIINQLDEPEVLSQEWIRNNQERKGVHFFVNVTKLQNLLVPKEESEVTLNRAFEKIAEAYPMTKEEVCRHLEKFVAHGGKVTYGEQEVLSQELPIVPTWFDEWWKDIPKGEGNLLHNIAQFHDKLYSYGTREMYDYINDTGNKKKLLDIIVNELDYEVEHKPLYHALIKGHDVSNSDDIYWNYDKYDNDVFVSRLYPSHDNFLTEMSKSEWNGLGINDSNADFVRVEE